MKRLILLFYCLMPITILAAARPSPLPESRLTGTLHGEGQTITNVANVVTSNGVSLVGLSNSKADATALSTTSNTLAQAIALKASTSALSTTSNTLAQAVALKASTSALSTTSNTLAQAVALKANASDLSATSNTFALALGNLSIGDPNALSGNLLVTSTAPLTLVVSNGLVYAVLPNGDMVGVTYYLPAYAVTEPTSDYPAGFTEFDFEANTTYVSPDAPQIAEWTKDAEPGKSIIASIENIDVNTVFVFAGEAGDVFMGDLVSYDGERLATIRVPAELDANQPYLMWAMNSNGFSRPVLLNKIIGWDVVPRRVWNGREFNIIGQNMELDGTSHVYVSELDLVLTTTNCTPYRATYTTTEAFTNGVYSLYPHNGHGMEFGWETNAITLYVTNHIDWSLGTIYNVTNYGAYGNGTTDCELGIEAAFTAASFGDTVYFPAGEYQVGNRITAKDGVRWLGEYGESIITTHPNMYVKGNFTHMIDMTTSDFARFENLWFENGTNNCTSFRLFNMAPGKDIEFLNCILSQDNTSDKSPDGLFYNNSYCTDWKFSNCIFRDRKGVWFYADYVLIEDCTFYGSYDQETLIKGLKNCVLVKDCIGHALNDLDPVSGWYEGRFFVATPRSRDTVVEGCVVDGLGTSPTSDQNSGEVILWEGIRPFVQGNVVYSNETFYTMSGLTANYLGYSIDVVAGRGLGQSRYIENDTSSGIIQISKPFNIAPDTNSIVVITMHPRNFAAYGNTFIGRERQVREGNGTASVGVSTYGGSYNINIENNSFTDIGGGFIEWSFEGSLDPTILAPTYFNFYKGNTIDGTRYLYRSMSNSDKTNKLINAKFMLGSVLRDNTVTNLYGSAIGATDGTYNVGRNDMTLFDGNTFDYTPQLLGADSNVFNFVFVDNTFQQSAPLYREMYTNKRKIDFINNSAPNLSNTFSGNELKPRLWFPRQANLYTSTNATIYNVGTLATVWSTSEASPWLSVEPSGIIGAGATGTIGLTLDETPTSGSTALVSIVTPAYSITNQYIYFNGTSSYFATGYTNISMMKLQTTFKYGPALANYDKLFGVMTPQTSANWFFGYKGNSKNYYQLPSEYNWTQDITGWQTLMVDCQTRWIVWDGVGSIGYTNNYPTFEIQMGRDTGGTSYMSAYLDYVMIWESNTLVRSYWAEDAYGTTLPDRTGNHDATLVNCVLTNVVTVYPATTNTFTVIYGDELGVE